jgi:hypothetical protein
MLYQNYEWVKVVSVTVPYHADPSYRKIYRTLPHLLLLLFGHHKQLGPAVHFPWFKKGFRMSALPGSHGHGLKWRAKLLLYVQQINV